MKILALLLVATTAMASKVKCVSDLPANNIHGLPVAWEVQLDTDTNEANIYYSGGPKDGAPVSTVISGVLPSDDYRAGYDLLNFGYSLNGRSLKLLLAFRPDGTAEMRFRVKKYIARPGSTLLEVAEAYCR